MKKFIILSMAILVVSSGLLLAFHLMGSDGKSGLETGEEKINYSPPTEEEMSVGNQIKEQVLNQGSDTTDDVTVVITDAAQYEDIVEVRSFVPNYYSDGTCTIVFSKNGDTLTKKTPAYRDASTSICTNPLIDSSEFSVGGFWDLYVEYSAGAVTARSETIKVNVR